MARRPPQRAARSDAPAASGGPVGGPRPPAIEIRGARQNNLKGIDLDLPLGEMIVVTGPSGSGKSSLAFDTIYAEGQRRYIETFSPYTRQFFERMDKPQVDDIRGIPPAIAIEQSNSVRNTRSTVGTMTEINDYLKLLFPRMATAVCPGCRRDVRPETPQHAATEAINRFAGRDVLVTFPVPVPAAAVPAEFFAFLQTQGFLRVRVFGEVHRTDEPAAYRRKTLPAVVDVIQDRVKIDDRPRAAEAPQAAPAAASGPTRTCEDGAPSFVCRPHAFTGINGRLIEALEQAFHFGKGRACLVDAANGTAEAYSRGWHCAHCDITIREPTPALFSFNNPVGACPQCRGFGRTIGIDIERAMPDPSLSIRGGLVKAFQGHVYAECQRDLVRAARARGVDPDAPFEDLPAADRKWVIEGDSSDPEEAWRDGLWYGVRGFFKWLEARSYKMHVRIFLSRYRAYTTCAACGGGRLQPEALNFRVNGDTLPDWWGRPVLELARLVRGLCPPDPTASMLLGEIRSRLGYLERVGLGYLTLDRAARTLSGGEIERVNLTSCLGASLVNTLFVMDEPSVGLHPRDVTRMIDVMHDLRDKGNTLLVVEHEEAVIRAADRVVDIGPGRGRGGGELVCELEMNGDTGSRGGCPPVPNVRKASQFSI
jgi:excinuclease ABC subunit A